MLPNNINKRNMLFSRLLIATSSVAIMGNSMVEGFAASRSSQIVSFHLSYYLHRVRCVVDYNASPLGGPLCTIYGVHNEEGRCVICVGCNALRCDGSPFLQPSTGWMPVHLGPSNIPPLSMYGNNTLIRSPKWVLPYGGDAGYRALYGGRWMLGTHLG